MPPDDQAPATTSILHLSDPHYGSGTATDTDWKVDIPHTERRTFADRLHRRIKELPRVPDLVIVSGDITIAGRQSGFDDFVGAFDELIESGHLPPAERVLVVPGNHDVDRDGDTDRDRWQGFRDSLGVRYPRPWMPGDPDVDATFALIEETLDPSGEVLGGLVATGSRTGVGRVRQLPFVFHRGARTLTYGFNSAIVAGTRVPGPPDVTLAVEWLEQYQDQALAGKLNLVLRQLRSRSSVDPARIDPRELELFTRVVALLGERLGDEFRQALKIAVLHHHVVPMRSEEVKEFDLVLNAGQFKAALRDAGFQVVVHGHKHEPAAMLDSAIPGGGALIVLAGGTVGGATWDGNVPGFSWIEYDPTSRALTNRFVDLRPTGTAGQAWDRATVTTFTVPHDSAAADAYLRAGGPRAGGTLELTGLLDRAARTLRGLIRQQQAPSGDLWHGWSYPVDESGISIGGSAFGLQIMRRAGVPLSVFDGAGIVRTLLARRLANGCWTSTGSRDTGWPETTSYVIRALDAWGYRDEVAEAVDAFEKAYSRQAIPQAWTRTRTLIVIVGLLAAVAPDSPMLREAATTLLSCAGDHAWWPRTADPDGARTPSTVHTAMALTALAAAHRATGGDGGLGPAAARPYGEWLLRRPEWLDDEESLSSWQKDGTNEWHLERYSAEPLVLRGLLATDLDPRHPRIVATARGIYQRCDADGLWSWHGRGRPLFMTVDALDALVAYAGRAAPIG